jgi:hypothetical protein
MAPWAVDGDGQCVCASCDRPDSSSQAAHRRVGSTWKASKAESPSTTPFLDQVDRPSREDFLSRLKYDSDPAFDVESSQDHRNAGRNRGVGIIAAGVHPTLGLRPGRVLRRLQDGESVDVGPETHQRIVAKVDPAACLRLTAVELEPMALDESSDQLGGSVFAVSRLRISMQEIA